MERWGEMGERWTESAAERGSAGGEFIRIRKKQRKRKYSLRSSPENSFTIRKYLDHSLKTQLYREDECRERGMMKNGIKMS